MPQRKGTTRKPSTSRKRAAAAEPTPKGKAPATSRHKPSTTKRSARKPASATSKAAAAVLELDTYGEHRKGCKVKAGEIEPTWYVPPIASTVENGRTVLILRCNDAECDAAVGWSIRNMLDVLEVLDPDLGHAALPGEEPAA